MKNDLQLELKVLKSACDSRDTIRSYLLPLLKEQHFSTSVTSHIFKRLVKLYVTTNNIPAWSDLIADPGIRKDARATMKELKAKTFKTESKTQSAYQTLERLRKVRAISELCANIEESLDQDAIDPDDIVSIIQSDLHKVSSNSADTVITRIGKDGNVDKLVKKIMTKGGVRRIATGLTEFDSRNVGFPVGGVVILAANTGGGKSALLDNILHHMAFTQGVKAAFLPLEMDAEENVTRSMSRVANVSMEKLIDPLNKMTEKEREEAARQYIKYSKAMEKRGGALDILEPGFAANIENILNYLDPLEYDVIAIDYVGLMDGVNGDDQWRALSNAVAYAKRWASRPNRKTLIIFAAQLTEEGFLKQSKAMADHCTNVIMWRVGEKEREMGLVELHQMKCRGGAVFSILQKVDFDHMLFSNPTKAEREEYELATRPDKKGKGSSWKSGGKKKESKKDRHELPEDDDDDDEEEEKPKKSKSNIKKHKFKPRRMSEY